MCRIREEKRKNSRICRMCRIREEKRKNSRIAG
jgi:hypothetical protein